MNIPVELWDRVRLRLRQQHIDVAQEYLAKNDMTPDKLAAILPPLSDVYWYCYHQGLADACDKLNVELASETRKQKL